MGNPLNYFTNTVSVEMMGTLEWNGRQLSAAIVDGVRYEYSYNFEGLRTRTVSRDAETNEINSIFNYFWNNGKMIGYCVTEEDGTVIAVLKNFFDNSGEQSGYELYLAENDEYLKFFFEKNLQGDIIGVYNEEGTKVLSYWYDAWGNVAPIYNDDNNDVLGQSIAAVLYTPITYRGYNYDVFTGLYYLQSRYYNPTYGRFLNADTTEILEATQGTPHGANLFAYCNNNPVNFVDYDGEDVTGIIVAIICLVVGVYFLGLLFSWLDIIPDFMFKWKITRVLKDSPELEKLVEFWAEYDDTTGYVFKYWYVYSLFMAHTKNLVDYARDPNLNYSYPEFNEIVGDNVSYQRTLELAYERLSDYPYYELGTRWEDLSPSEQHDLVLYMAYYDPFTYHHLIPYTMHALLEKNVEDLIDFFEELLDIAVRRV